MRWLPLLASLLLSYPSLAEASALERPAADGIARFALVIGKNEPESTEQAILRYADDDAIAMHELFQEAGIRSLLLVTPDQDTAALREIGQPQKPTLAAVLRAFDDIAREMQALKSAGRKTEFTFFYSGHGDVADGEGFVVLDGARLTRTVLLKQIIARSPADANHVVIDACKSYFLVFDKGPGGERRPFHRSFSETGSGKNLARTGFVLSSTTHEESHEWERFQAGIFSYEVRSALRGGADANLDGHITYGELGAFVATANRGIVNPRFRPDFLVSPPGKTPANLSQPLLHWNDQVPGLTVDPATAGHYYIETASGIRVADVHPRSPQQLSVHLPRARPLFVRQADDLAEGVLNTGDPVRLSALTMQPATVARKGALTLAFEALFTTPFGMEMVTAYDVLYAEKSSRLSLPPAPEPDRTKLARQILVGVSAGTLVLGGTMSILALSVRRQAQGSSQSEIPSLNRTITRYNTAAIALYSVAAASGISWLTLRLLSSKGSARATTIIPIVSPTELALGLTASWGN